MRVVGRSLEAAGIVDGAPARVAARLPATGMTRAERLGYALALMRTAAAIFVEDKEPTDGIAAAVTAPAGFDVRGEPGATVDAQTDPGGIRPIRTCSGLRGIRGNC